MLVYLCVDMYVFTSEPCHMIIDKTTIFSCNKICLIMCSVFSINAHLCIKTESLALIGTVAKSVAIRPLGTGFASWYRLQPRASFKDPLGRCKTIPSSFSITCNNQQKLTNSQS